MAVSAPGDTPLPGGYDDQNMWQRLWNYINPVQPAAADTLNQAPNPLANPSPVPPQLQGGGPPVPPALLGGGQPPAPMPSGAPVPPIPTPVAGGSTGGGGASSAVGPSILPQARGLAVPADPSQNPTPWFTPSNTPYAPNAPMPPLSPKPVTGPAVARGSNRPTVSRVPNAATSTAPNDRFAAMQYGTAQRGPGSTPYITALNLGGLFGGGANPANVPAANAQPVSASAPVGGPLAKGGMSDAAVARLMSNSPGHIAASPDQLSTYMRTQPWLQNLAGAAGQQRTPSQLAADVRKPNWWANLGA